MDVAPAAEARPDRAAGEKRGEINCIHATALFGCQCVNRPLTENQISGYGKVYQHTTKHYQPKVEPRTAVCEVGQQKGEYGNRHRDYGARLGVAAVRQTSCNRWRDGARETIVDGLLFRN